MKKKFLGMFGILVLMVTMFTGCQSNHFVSVRRGATKQSVPIYYNEDWDVDGYEWNGTDLIIHFKER